MISIILGTKAQLIKMAPVMRCLTQEGIYYRFIHTGQHRETMDDMYADFTIKKPDLFLYDGPDITSVLQIFKWFTKLTFISIFHSKSIFGKSEKNIVLVHGDTLSTLLGAIMGRMAGLKVAHVESGLRSFNYFQPFPEEITRMMVFRLSNVLFCPGAWAVGNVSRYKRKEVIDTIGNTMTDTVRLSSKKVETDDSRLGRYAIVSLHRYENIFDKKQLGLIVDLLENIAIDHKLLFILHPPTKKQLLKYHLLERLEKHANIECSDRMHHSKFLHTLDKAEFVVTDGGSLQEETAFLGIPCLLFRNATERQDGLGGNVVLSKFDKSIIENFLLNFKLLKNKSIQTGQSPSRIIVERIKSYS